MKKLSLLFAAAFASASMFATGLVGGSYQIGGENADYASLHAAAVAINAEAIQGDVTLLIAADLTETENTGILNPSNFTITIRPDGETRRTVTYTTVADNDGPSGNFIIGGQTTGRIPFAVGGIATKKVVVENLSIVGTTTGGRAMVLYGNVSDITIRNCSIKHTRTTGTNYAMEIRTEKNTDNRPNNILVDNCYLEATGSANTQAIVFNGSQKSTAAGVPTNVTFKDCEVVSNLRGIFFNGANDVNIEGCTFRLPHSSTGFLAYAIMGNAQTGTINVKGCKFPELKTQNTSAGAYGIYAIAASGGATVWNIENNYFCGFDALAELGEKAITIQGVRCGDSCVVRHNTFVMPVLTKKPATELVAASPITLLYLAGSKQYIVENNIFVSEEVTANNSLIRGSLNANCKNNVFYHAGGNAAIVAGAATCANFEALTTNYSAQAATSKWTAVNFTNAAAGDLSLTGTSDGDENLAVPAIDAVATDINGTLRGTPLTYAGAFEAITDLNEAPADEITWSDFLGNGSDPVVSDYTNCFKYSTPLPQGVGVENIQTPGFATAPGIYMTFPAVISECSLGAGNYDVQGTGVILHCDAFVQKITEVTVVDGQGSYTFYIWNENGSDGQATDLENVEATEAKKFFRNGQIFIQKGNAVYTMTGVRVE